MTAITASKTTSRTSSWRTEYDRVFTVAATVIRRALLRIEYRRAVAALQAMDDHALKDMGLDRGGIVGAVHTGGDRPRRAPAIPGC